MSTYVALLIDGDKPIAATLDAFHHDAELQLGPDYDFRFERFPHKAHTWHAFAEIPGEPPAQWCAGCGGGRPRARYKPAAHYEGNPYCGPCAEKRLAAADAAGVFIKPDGNVMNRHRNPAAWDEWVRISESWGYP